MDQIQSQTEGVEKINEEIISSLTSVSTEKNRKMKFALKHNLPEKIVICIDVSDEMKKYYFSLKDKQSSQSFKEHLGRALVIFLRTKMALNARHEFSILLYGSSSFWVSAFTRDLDQLVEIVRNLPSLQTDNHLDISIIFDSLLTTVPLNHHDNPPSHVYRTILIYARHFCVPTFDASKYEAFKDSDNFILDVLYLYNPETSDNHCEEIFDSFCQLDFHGTSYIMAASEGPEVHQGLAQMLGHPLQRPLQKEVSLSLNNMADPSN